MSHPSTFELQGHRGARGLRPENTLPSFELAMDLGVDAIETDVHLTSDGVPLLGHEPVLDERHCRKRDEGGGTRDEINTVTALPSSLIPHPSSLLLVASLTLDQIRRYRADVNPDPMRFPRQQAEAAPLAELLAAQWGVDPYGLPTVAELYSFVRAYAGAEGVRAGKSDLQRHKASQLIFDLEIKRVPFYPELINDGFAGRGAGLLEVRLLEEIQRASMLKRTRVRSFDHRSLAALKVLERSLEIAVLIAETAPVSPGLLARQVGAAVYCPDYRFVDEALVRQAQAEGVRVIPWTVNDPAHWKKLRGWGVDGITTDFPNLLQGDACQD